MQNLCRICAKIARKLRANWAEKSSENRRKIARKLRVNVLWLRRKVFHGFVYNNPIYKAPECQKTSVPLADRNSRAN